MPFTFGYQTADLSLLSSEALKAQKRSAVRYPDANGIVSQIIVNLGENKWVRGLNWQCTGELIELMIYWPRMNPSRASSMR